MQMPAQALLRAPARVDEVVAVVDQQLQLAVDPLVRPRPAQVRLTERRTRDRQRVDRVGLAARAAGSPLRHRQLRRHPHQLLTNAQKLPLQPAGQLPAVLDRPQPLAVERLRPAKQLVAANLDQLLSERAARFVDGDRGHRALVYVQSDHDHLHRLQAVGGDRRADRPQSRPDGHAPIRSRSTVSVGGGDTTLGSQTKSTFGLESAAADETLQAIGRGHSGDDDIEFRNVPRRPPIPSMGHKTPRLTGTMRWWKPEKGYGRITGDDDYVYFVPFSDIVPDGGDYRKLREGQRVEFDWRGRLAANDRKHASNVRPIRCASLLPVRRARAFLGCTELHARMHEPKTASQMLEAHL
jgi:cold shock protein